MTRTKMNKTAHTSVIAITSGKGGVGKTTVSINLAAALRQLKQKVMLFDADMGLANIDVLLGLNPKYNLSHVMRGECELEDIIIDGPQGLRVVPAVSGIQKMAQLSVMEHGGIINAFSDLKQDIDTLIIDTAAGISDGVLSFCQAAGEVLIVICDEPASLTDSYGLIKVLNRDYGVERFHVLANRVDNSADGFLLYQRLLNATDQFLHVNIDYLGSVPNDQLVKRANQSQKLLADQFPHAPAVRAYADLARRIASWTPQQEPRGGMEFFFERLVAQSTTA